MSDRRSESADQIKKQVGKVAEMIFNVVTEDPRNHMFPMRCSHEPCKNIEVRSGRNDPGSEEAGQAANARSK